MTKLYTRVFGSLLIFYIQLRTSYPEDNFLLPWIYFALIIGGVGILVAIFSLVFNSRTQPKEKTIKTFKQVKPDVPRESEYFIKLGNHKIPVSKTEATKAKRDGYTVLEI